jgi:hypothetical protein
VACLNDVMGRGEDGLVWRLPLPAELLFVDYPVGCQQLLHETTGLLLLHAP